MELKMQERVHITEDVAVTGPPARPDLPRMQPKAIKPSTGALATLARLATRLFGGSSTPRPDRKVHNRPRRGFD